MKKQTLEEFINSQPYYGHGTPEYLEGIEVGAKWQQEQAKEMEKEQRDTLLKYIEEVRDLCGKLRFPTEEELRDLTNKADGILNQFKQQEQ
jgi:hypothetical protein